MALIVTAIAGAVAEAGPIPLAIPGGAAAASERGDAQPGPDGGAAGAGKRGATSDAARSRVMVAVIKAADADPDAREIVTRIVAELVADGVSVVALTCPRADAACVADSGTRVSAVVLVRSRPNVRAVEVHASDAPITGRLVVANAAPGGRVQRVGGAEGGAGPAVLAVRTVEMLRAMLTDDSHSGAEDVEVHPEPVVRAAHARPAQGEDAVDAPPPTPRLVPTGPHNLTMTVGGAMFAGFDGLNAAFGPALSIGRRTSDHVLLSVALAGLAYAPDQGNPAGTVSVRHDLVALQADVLSLVLRRVVLRVGLGAGLYHVSIEGRPNPLLQPGGAGQAAESGRTTGAFAGLLSWSAGMVVNLRPRLGVYLDGRLFVLTRTPVVLLSGVEVGRVGNPQLCLTSGLEFRL